ncbi:MAG: alpha/beta fold hydrolase [Chloroflexi bacterium CFX4]|nr:alpha/beta fold hydrolase [Chloroflexi bacterium CFX4]MDL1922657.1 alpha/beta fold hydrolase [Chloroflexi bacterium CFX3]
MLPPITAFQGAEHAPFLMQGGKAAALMVHGFPGTPADIRPLADCLSALDWTVQGILLPGFGVEIETLPKRTHKEWSAAVREALQALQKDHAPVLLVGHSMGGALVMGVAAETPADGLILSAPFSKIENILWGMMPVFRALFPEVRPFRLIRLDFSKPEVREGIRNFMPDADLDDPQVQHAIRDLRLPITVFEQIRQVGQRAFNLAPQLKMPAFILQGTEDTLVKPHLTRQLVSRYGGAVRYLEVPAEHSLIDPRAAYWSQVENALREFVEQFR